MPQGYNQKADLVTTTKDGRDLNGLWVDYQAVLESYNAERSALVNFLTFGVVDPIEEVPILGQGTKFEKASEFGRPKGVRTGLGSYSIGYPFDWYDLAARFTWMFLADATAQQVDSIQNAAIEADNELVFNAVMKRIFDNTNTTANINKNPYNVYTFYNGVGEAPPKWRQNTFTSNHTHYTTTNGATLDAEDLDFLIEQVTEHGYTKALGYRIVVMVNKAQSPRIRSFRSASGRTDSPGTVDATHADWDFIPSVGTNAMLLPQNQLLLGAQPAATLEGFNVIGSYGDALIIEEDYIPVGYLFCFATGGVANLGNPIGMRQHVNPDLQGMRLVKGPNPDYPLIDSAYIRGFGLGVRHRGAGAVMQVVTGTTYTPPANFDYL
jgi:hypothetical protein